MTRFFVSPEQIDAGIVTFTADDAHHMHVVLKMRAGDRCIVLDGIGRACNVVLSEVGKSRAVGRVEDEFFPATEPSVRITVAQALPKMLDKLEQVLQHGTEVGVDAFKVFSCTCARAEPDRFERKIPRWRQIVKTAAEQSERAMTPSVDGIVSLADIIASAAEYDMALIAYEREPDVSLKSVLSGAKARRILVIIGPEGGFTDEEVSLAIRSGITAVSLGPRILRTETAALVIASQILYALDDAAKPN